MLQINFHLWIRFQAYRNFAKPKTRCFKIVWRFRCYTNHWLKLLIFMSSLFQSIQLKRSLLTCTVTVKQRKCILCGGLFAYKSFAGAQPNKWKFRYHEVELCKSKNEHCFQKVSKGEWTKISTCEGGNAHVKCSSKLADEWFERNVIAGIMISSRNRIQHLSDWSTYSGWVYLAKINNSKTTKQP